MTEGEECDGGPLVFPNYCSKTCQLTQLGLKYCQKGEICVRPYCGDGVLTKSNVESCDDGNSLEGDGCN